MSKTEESREILKALGLPLAQCNELSALTLLALCNIKESDNWSKATKSSMTLTKGIMNFVANNYDSRYAPNTRETFRRQVLHQFIQARIVDYNPDIPDLPVNSPRAHYSISDNALKVIRTYGKTRWKKEIKLFMSEIGGLKDIYDKKRDLGRIPVTMAGKEIRLSAGKHNEVQVAVVNEFAPRFAKGGIVLYLGDTENKDLHIDRKGLEELGINLTEHSKLPDVVIYDPKKNWLFLIEVVTSHGPMSPKRLMEIEDFLKNCKAGKIFVTAFPDKKEYRKNACDIAWETEVWISDSPDHMIHFNGDRFLGPR